MAKGPAYSVCRYVRHYHEKNGCAPVLGMLPCDEGFARRLIENGILDILPTYEGGPAIGIVLTDKGRRMSG